MKFLQLLSKANVLQSKQSVTFQRLSPLLVQLSRDQLLQQIDQKSLNTYDMSVHESLSYVFSLVMDLKYKDVLHEICKATNRFIKYMLREAFPHQNG